MSATEGIDEPVGGPRSRIGADVSYPAMSTCAHEPPYVARACSHVLAEHDGYTEVFVGRSSELLCSACATTRPVVVEICAACELEVRRADLDSVLGSPPPIIIASSLRLSHTELELGCPDLVDLRPITGADRNRWIGLSSDALYELDLDTLTARLICATDHGSQLVVSANARFAAVFQPRGTRGAVISLATLEVTLPLLRADYHAEHCNFPIAFLEREGKTIVCHARLWNRLDLYDASTGEELTPREQGEYVDQRPPHYLDYFHCGLVVSPDGSMIADNGWVWHPVGEVVTWSIDAWLDNVWESEDGSSRKLLLWRTYYWDGPLAWLDNQRLLVWGYGKDDGQLADAVMIYDTKTGTTAERIEGVPAGDMYVDGYLHVLADGRLSIWDTGQGVRLLDVETSTVRYHPDAKVFASLPAGGRVTTARVHGYHGEWDVNAALLADPDGLAVLADALEAAGYEDREILAHCRSPGPHGAHCWVFDRLAR
ncbi:hypothetical protein BH11MYX1_BH11MYX1_09070 [soil metagenome]